MSLSPFSVSTRLSERLTPAKIRELAELIAKSEHPQPSAALVTPLLELVSGTQLAMHGPVSRPPRVNV